jgi:hypothetical protein
MGKPKPSGTVLAVLCLSAIVALASPTDVPFTGCGEFIQGVECILFQADSGGLYLTDGLHGYSVGDRVYIEGNIWECTSFCMEEDACLDVELIEPCSVSRQQTTWGAIKAIYRLD